MRLPERLPPIAGSGRTIFTLVWLVSLAAALQAHRAGGARRPIAPGQAAGEAQAGRGIARQSVAGPVSRPVDRAPPRPDPPSALGGLFSHNLR